MAARPEAAPAGPAPPPPLKWAGGKRWLVPRLRPLWERAGAPRVVEPFCGALSVALGLAPARALLCDANEQLVNFLLWLQRGLRVHIPMRNEAELFYRHRAEFNRLVAGRGRRTRKAAELFYYLNRTGYNGLCRFNRRGQFNVPFGRYEAIAYRRDFSAYREALSGWEIARRDFAELALEPGDFVYADPPYDVEFRTYAPDGFDWSEQVRLAEWLADHPGPVVASNQATSRIVALYRGLGLRVSYVQGPRRISCDGDRTPAREMLAVRNLG